MQKKDKIFFIFETVFLLLYVILVILFAFSDITLLNSNRSCLFEYVTGYYCPACGGTRATENLLRLNFLYSLIYHPVVIFVFISILVAWGSKIIAVITKYKTKIYNIGINYIMYINAIFFIWFLLRNLLIYYWNFYLY